MTSVRSTSLALGVCFVLVGAVACDASSSAPPPPDDRPAPQDTFEDTTALSDVGVDAMPDDDRPAVTTDVMIDAAGLDVAIDRETIDVPREASTDAGHDAGAVGDVGRDAPADVTMEAAVMGCGTEGPCAADQTCCDGRCVDTRSDRNHCGVCGRGCLAVCNAGVCRGAMQLALGQEHTCVALSDRSVRCWGRNDEGQLGIGTASSTPVLRPVPVPGMTNTSYLQAGRHHTYARTEAGTVALWGENAGALGDGATAPRSTPFTLPGIAGIGVGRAIAAAALRGCVVVPLTRLHCWGANSLGQLGDGTTVSRLSPVEVRDIAVTRVATGPVHTCAILSDRTMRCWGRNASGQVGDATTTDRLRPTEVMGISTATDVCAGDGHSCARLADGTVRCWGRNTEGQVGDGTLTDRATPTVVPGLERITSVSCGAFHSCAVRSDGSVWCWGSNLQGELGGTSTDRSVPTPRAVGMLPNSVYVFAGWHRTCAVTIENGAYCWGDNTRGALGEGTTIARRVPTAVAW